jgi:hypothetical protein
MGLDKALRRVLSRCDSASTDARLISLLLLSLESESITMKFSPLEVLGMRAGVRAVKSLSQLFGRCEEAVRLLPNGASLQPRQQWAENYFPRLKYEADSLRVELHLRVPGLEEWSGGHTLALGLWTNEPTKYATALWNLLNGAEQRWQFWCCDR